MNPCICFRCDGYALTACLNGKDLSWWDTERCPNCDGHIHCCGCDRADMKWRDCVHT